MRLALERNGEGADPRLRAAALYGLGSSSLLQGNLEAANLFYEESLRLAREINDRYWASAALGGVGNVKFMQGDLTLGMVLMEESLAIARELNDRRLISRRLNGLGEIARAQKDYKAARKYYEEALAIAREESSKHLIPACTFNLASVACLSGDYELAHSNAVESLKVSEELGDKIGVGEALNVFAALAVKTREMEKAALLCGAAQALHDATGFKLEKVDREFIDHYTSQARTEIGDEAFEAAFREGQSMRLKNVLALAHEMH